MPATATATESSATRTKSRPGINRENAQSSTGPRTPEGKATSCQNALKFGLFSTANCIRPGEQTEYDELAAHLWASLKPVGAIEELHATEVIRCTWRLRRCAIAEAGLPNWNKVNEEKRLFNKSDNSRLADPVFYDYSAAVQASIDRARSQAQSGLRRALADVKELQTERHFRYAVHPPDFDPSLFGLADTRKIVAGLGNEAQRKLLTAKVNEIGIMNAAAATKIQDSHIREALNELRAKTDSAKQTGRNAPCPCGSGQKHKRCCGQNAPPVLTRAAGQAPAH
jgi:hypothetical protein